MPEPTKDSLVPGKGVKEGNGVNAEVARGNPEFAERDWRKSSSIFDTTGKPGGKPKPGQLNKAAKKL